MKNGRHPDPERSEGEGAATPECFQLLGWARLHGPIAGLGVTTLLLLTACTSPEAARTRGGGPGADVKNWSQPVEMHAGAEIYHETPCVTEPVECTGPPPVFGPTPPPD